MTHICWLRGVVHEYNPDGRCYVCEGGSAPADRGLTGMETEQAPVPALLSDKMAGSAPQIDEKSQIPDREGTE